MRVRNWYKKSYDGSWHEFYKEGEAPQVVKDAILQLATDPNRFKTEYISTKDYDRWVGQHNGWTSYGMGPRHGSTTFEIEFRLRKEQPDLTSQEVDACIYYLEKQAFRVLGEGR
jgi:hypothetical protein